MALLTPIFDRESGTPGFEWTSGPRGFLDWLVTLVPLGLVWILTLTTIIGGIWLMPSSGPAWSWLSIALGGLIFVPMAIMLTLPALRPGRRRIRILPDAQTVQFENVRLFKSLRPPRFLPAFSCSFAELQYVELLPGRRGGPDWLIITTPLGRIYLTSFADDLSDMHRMLSPFTQSSKPPLSQSGSLPAIIAGVIVFGALIIGFAMGWLP